LKKKIQIHLEELHAKVITYIKETLKNQKDSSVSVSEQKIEDFLVSKVDEYV